MSASSAARGVLDRPLILVIEDEPAIVDLLDYNLTREGFRVLAAEDGEAGLALALEEQPQIVLIDWMLPLLSGVEVCRRLRAHPLTADVPLIMLTARAEEADKVRGLEAGADDYITKPFSPVELAARIRAVLRRAQPKAPFAPAGGTAAAELLRVGELTLDGPGHRVRRRGRDVHLGPTEFKLLRILMQSPGRVFSREQLLELVWGEQAEVELRTVDVHIRRLRRAVNAEGEPELIRTVRSAGYALDAEPPADPV